MAAQPTRANTFLRAGLLAMVLALIAGVLGMHVIMSGTHTMHQTFAAGTAAGATAVVNDTGAGDHAATAHPGHSLFVPAGTSPAPQPQCSCSGNCTNEHVMAGACIPSAATGSLAAPLPDSAAAVPASLHSLAVQPMTAWSYLPNSPTPGDLSISRT
ncbi:hypothetical protein ACIPYU_07655 [Paenarthrobacter nicotinovorans]|uniref:hypothetical protein n=1 Tax=Paenarthrobacter nicotinovorans TaxID=29320 RepID=UPI0037F64DA6